MTKRSFGSVVGRLDAFVVNERPEPLSVRVELVAHACEPLVARTGATQQERIDLGAHRCHSAPECPAGDSAFVIGPPVFEKSRHMPHEVMAEPLGLGVRAVDQGLKVSLEV